MLYTIAVVVTRVQRRTRDKGPAESWIPTPNDRRSESENPPVVEESKDGRQLATASGLPLKDHYDRTDAPAPLEAPGAYPFTRGITPRMYREELWHKDLYAGFGSAEDARQRYEFLLAQGASGVNIALDLPTQLGLDSDHPSARGEVGKVGLAVDTLSDLEFLFQNTRLDQAQIVFTVANGIGPLAMAWFAAIGDLQGIPRSSYVVHLQNDPLKEFTGRGAYVLPIEPSVRLACDAIEYAVASGYQHWKPIGVCGSQYRWGGGTAIQEIAFGVCEAIPFIDELLRRGLGIDEFAPIFEMHLSADIDLFEEVAKFRAARRVWAKLLKERYGATDPRSCQLKISIYTGGWRLTKQEPLNNSVRIAIQALAAALGGVQHLGTLSIDEALSTPSQEAVQLAVRTQQILAYEARAGHVVDPLGGSYLVESLTDQLEQAIWDLIAGVEREGGTVAAIRNGYFQQVITETSYRYALAIEDGTEVAVGVNRFVSGDQSATSVKTFTINDEVEQRQLTRLKEIKESRSNDAVRRTLAGLHDAAEAGENVMDPLLSSVKSNATCGEIFDVLRDVHGSYSDERIAL
jgi:methylmalonyl-CoA mutase N-terminal domain/subunit